MPDTLAPTTDTEVRDIVSWAAAEEAPLEIVGAGTRRTIGRPAQAAHTLALSGLAGIVLYEPEELVLSVKAGTPLAEVSAALADAGQAFAFEPIDTGPLLGLPAGGGTVGGLFATGLSGSRRLAAGAVRDHMLGLAAVSGRGEIFKAGGRVVKNVTGYDLARGLAASWGTLAVATELTFKVLPRAETEATLAITGLTDRQAVALMSAAMGSPNDVSGAAHLPAKAASAVPSLQSDKATTLLRLEGFGPSVAARTRDLEAIARATGAGEIRALSADPSRQIWQAVRDALPLVEPAGTAVWRISVQPTRGPTVVEAVSGDADALAYYDWAGGLVWMQLPEHTGGDAGMTAIRAAVSAAGGGHATLIRGSAELRARIAPFQPQAAANAALSRRLKEQFDPRGILNPGRRAPGA